MSDKPSDVVRKPYNPGPWNFGDDGKLRDSQGKLIYQKDNDLVGGSRKLIEQAPQLYESLALLFDHFCNEQDPKEINDDSLNPEFRAIYVKARKALTDANIEHQFKPPTINV